jgi:hypothetical protein
MTQFIKVATADELLEDVQAPIYQTARKLHRALNEARSERFEAQRTFIESKFDIGAVENQPQSTQSRISTHGDYSERQPAGGSGSEAGGCRSKVSIYRLHAR